MEILNNICSDVSVKMISTIGIIITAIATGVTAFITLSNWLKKRPNLVLNLPYQPKIESTGTVLEVRISGEIQVTNRSENPNSIVKILLRKNKSVINDKGLISLSINLFSPPKVSMVDLPDPNVTPVPPLQTIPVQFSGVSVHDVTAEFDADIVIVDQFDKQYFKNIKLLPLSKSNK